MLAVCFGFQHISRATIGANPTLMRITFRRGGFGTVTEERSILSMNPFSCHRLASPGERSRFPS